MEDMRMLSHNQAKRFYDRFGARLDSQAFYELPALRDLVEHLELKMCRAVVEFGCGTGRLAGDLLETWLPPEANYLGLDISGMMVSLTESRLARYGRRAEVRQSDGEPRIDRQDGTFDRFICSYVLDLLPDDEIRLTLREAHRVLNSTGILGVVSLTKGTTAASVLVSTAWKGLHSISPWLVGGCRPIEILAFLAPSEWRIEYRNVVTAFGVPSEIVVERKVVARVFRHPLSWSGLQTPTFLVGPSDTHFLGRVFRHPLSWSGLQMPTFLVGNGGSLRIPGRIVGRLRRSGSGCLKTLSSGRLARRLAGRGNSGDRLGIQIVGIALTSSERR